MLSLSAMTLTRNVNINYWFRLHVLIFSSDVNFNEQYLQTPHKTKRREKLSLAALPMFQNFLSPLYVIDNFLLFYQSLVERPSGSQSFHGINLNHNAAAPTNLPQKLKAYRTLTPSLAF